MAIWKDVSSFSKNDKVRTPRTFELAFGAFRLVVTRHIHYADNVWLAKCDGLFSERELRSVLAGDAKQEATKLAVLKLKEALEEL